MKETTKYFKVIFDKDREVFDIFDDKSNAVGSNFPTQQGAVEKAKGLMLELGKGNTYDVVKKPSHYNSGKYEVIDIIESVLGSLGLAPFNSYCMGNAIKYICRAGLKGDFKEDIKKAIMYLTWAMGEDPRK